MHPPAPSLDLEATLATNMAVVSARWPALAAEIEAAEVPTLEHVFPGGPQPGLGTLRADGLQLSSAHDRVAEANLQAQRVPEDAACATVYGLGLGDLIRALAARPSLTSLRLVIMNHGAAKAGLAFANNIDWLRDRRVELLFGGHEAEPQEPFAAVPPALQLADDACLLLRDAIDARLQEAFVQERWQERSTTLDQHIAENESLVREDGDVGTLFGKARGSRVLVAGPGPTLSQQLATLRTQQPGAILIAISTALSPLLDAGLIPDYVVMIDSHSVHPVRPEQEALLSNVPLVYLPEVQRCTLEAWPGPRLAAYLDRPRYSALRTRLPRAQLWTSGTVTHSAVDLAVRLGAAQVMLFGLDFSYPGGQSHAPGTPDFQQQHGQDRGRSLPNGQGARVPSDPNLIQYLRDLEQYIRRTAGVSFTRADRRAAAMEGVTWIDD